MRDSDLHILESDGICSISKLCDSTASAVAVERALAQKGFLPPTLALHDVIDSLGFHPARCALDIAFNRATREGKISLFSQLWRRHDQTLILHCNTSCGTRYWTTLKNPFDPRELQKKFSKILSDLRSPICIFPHGTLASCRLPTMCRLGSSSLGYTEAVALARSERNSEGPQVLPEHLQRLEDEAIYIFREAVAQAQRPVLLYSIGKDSSVLLHLARKAFFPEKIPLPLLHVDTGWKFREMYAFRSYVAALPDIELRIHRNERAIRAGVSPFNMESAQYTDIVKTQALREALNLYAFDVVIGGARRDEEPSRAKERIFSYRDKNHQWDPTSQRAEVWSLYNGLKKDGEEIRVFPLSNWTELDVWEYIYYEKIRIPSLYFSTERCVIVKDGSLIAVDDDRMPVEKNQVETRYVRFRTLGCYPLTAAIESTASSVEEILLELSSVRTSERVGRLIDVDQAGSMERKKRQGYF